MAMENSKLIRKIHMECPLCDKLHEVEQRTRVASIIIKGEEIKYNEIYYFCKNSDEDENEFVTGKMENENLLNARNEYRKEHNLLTSNQIVEIREKYGLSQVDLARLLGWGEATISRYESKAIQDEAYDNMLRIIKDNPLAAFEFFQKNKDKFEGYKKIEIKRKIMDNLDSDGKEYLQRQALESEYVDYQDPCEANGYTLLNIDKLELVVSYLARRITNLYKVKLMKLLWYTDALYYKQNGKSMTGLVYRHDNMGALPIGHYNIVGLENIVKREEEDFEFTKYHFYVNEKLDEDLLSSNEKNVLDNVIMKFASYNSKDIVKYMHSEIAYVNTKDGDIIPYDLSEKIRVF